MFRVRGPTDALTNFITMKTVRNVKTNALRRVRDDEARKLVEGTGEFRYVPKSEWKAEHAKIANTPVIDEDNPPTPLYAPPK